MIGGAKFRSRSARAYDDQLDVDRWREDANHAKRSMESPGLYSGVGPKNNFKAKSLEEFGSELLEAK